MPIENVDDLREHLAAAIAVEVMVFPPYLYAMYSLADQAGEAAADNVNVISHRRGLSPGYGPGASGQAQRSGPDVRAE